MKFTIKQSSNDKKLVIPFGGINNLLGYDDDMETLVSNETDNSINNETDLEVRRFKSAISTNFEMWFHFWNGLSYVFPNSQTSLAPLDFAANGLTSSSSEVRNSFFIIQIFDSFDEDIQKKLHTGYFNGYDFTTRAGSSGLSTNYVVDNDSEFLSLYIQNSFFEGMSGLVTLYAKFFFYSAQSSKFYPFSNIQSPTTVQSIYIPITFNLNTYTYTYPTNLIDFYEITNPAYATLINDTVDSLPVQQTKYPSGNTFTSDGIYIED